MGGSRPLGIIKQFGHSLLTENRPGAADGHVMGHHILLTRADHFHAICSGMIIAAIESCPTGIEGFRIHQIDLSFATLSVVHDHMQIGNLALHGKGDPADQKVDFAGHIVYGNRKMIGKIPPAR